MWKQLLTLGILVLTAPLTFAGPDKISKDLKKRNPNDTVDVIVQFKQSPKESHHKKIRDKGGRLKKKLSRVKGGVYSLKASRLASLAADPDVAYISPDRQVKASLDYATPSAFANIAHQYGWDGQGIGVAVIDSGIDKKHEDLLDEKPRTIYQESFLSAAGGAADKYGHGTHVAGIVAGNGEESDETYLGIAPKARLINLRVLDENGQGTDSSVIAAIERAIQLKDQYNIRVINLSLGRPVFESYTTDPLCQAVEAAWNAGIVVVVAAGNLGRDNSFDNQGYGTITSPGNDPFVITVGAMKTSYSASRADDLIASYSSKGPTLIDHVVKPDLVAPGNRIISLLATGSTSLQTAYPENLVGSEYFKLSGTSMATPMVSGAVALMLEKDPSLTPDQVKARLMKTASKAFPPFSTVTDAVTGELYTSQYDIFTIGAGYLDVMAALDSPDVADASALSPSAVYDEASGEVRLVHGDSVVWGTSMVWGTGVVWGTSLVWGTTVVPGTDEEVDGSSLVWGTGVVWGTGMVWGTSMVWGTESPYADSVVWGTGVVWGTNVLVEGEE